MKIVIDTNIIYGDFFLKNAQIISLCETASRCGIGIYIPEVVMDEIINQYREKLVEICPKVNDCIRGITQIAPQYAFNNPFTDAVKDKLLKEYESYIRIRINELGIKIIPYPHISHKDVVKRDLARKRPFQNSGKGYRDALIWESVLDIMEHTETPPAIVFINRNTKDFFDKDVLHPDLIEDLVSKDFKITDLNIYNEISGAIKEHIKPRQERLEEMTRKYAGTSKIETIDLNVFVENKIDDELRNLFSDEDIIPRLEIKSYVENPELSAISSINCSVTDIRMLTDDKIIVEADAQIEFEYEAFLFKADTPLIDDRDMPTIIDDDWNKHYMLVADTSTIDVNLSLVIDSGLNEILNYSIEFNI